jgi:hypothetical protein
MNSSNKFTTKLESLGTVIDSLDAPKIKAGSSSSSTILNKFHDALTKDLASLVVFINQLVFKANRIVDGTATQAAALNSPLTTLETRVDTLIDTNFVLADFFTSRFISTSGSDTTAEIDNVFGQATLPVTATTNLLVTTDSFNNSQVSREVQLGYSTATSPQTSDFIESGEWIGMLLRKNVWVIDSSTQPVWVKIKAPLQYLGLNPNTIEIYPYPCWGVDISNVQYQAAGASTGDGWTDFDISYLPGYDAGTSKILGAGPLRIHHDGTPLSQIRFKLTPKSAYNVGLYDFKITSREYSQTASLTVKDPNLRTLTGVTIYGKNPTDLALLPTTGTTNKVRIDMSSTSTLSTPVISGVVMEI